MEFLPFFSQLNQAFSFGIVVWETKLLRHGNWVTSVKKKRLTPFLLESLQLFNGNVSIDQLLQHFSKPIVVCAGPRPERSASFPVSVKLLAETQSA